MMKYLMSATAFTALVATSPAFGQGGPTADPAIESAPGMETRPMTPAPEATAPEHAMPRTQAEVPTLPPPQNVTPAADHASSATEMFIAQQEPSEVLASSLIGSTVEGPSDEVLGILTM